MYKRTFICSLNINVTYKIYNYIESKFSSYQTYNCHSSYNLVSKEINNEIIYYIQPLDGFDSEVKKHYKRIKSICSLKDICQDVFQNVILFTKKITASDVYFIKQMYKNVENITMNLYVCPRIGFSSTNVRLTNFNLDIFNQKIYPLNITETDEINLEKILNNFLNINNE